MTPEEILAYDWQLSEYFDIITDKLHAGKIDVDKFDRLAEKIEEWGEEASRKGRR